MNFDISNCLDGSHECDRETDGQTLPFCAWGVKII